MKMAPDILSTCPAHLLPFPWYLRLSLPASSPLPTARSLTPGFLPTAQLTCRPWLPSAHRKQSRLLRSHLRPCPAPPPSSQSGPHPCVPSLRAHSCNHHFLFSGRLSEPWLRLLLEGSCWSLMNPAQASRSSSKPSAAFSVKPPYSQGAVTTPFWDPSTLWASPNFKTTCLPSGYCWLFGSWGGLHFLLPLYCSLHHVAVAPPVGWGYIFLPSDIGHGCETCFG